MIARDHAYFWATHQGAELDLLLMRGARRIGVEIKRSDAPLMTRSMRSALDDLRLNKLWVISADQLDRLNNASALPPIFPERFIGRPMAQQLIFGRSNVKGRR